MVDDVDNVVVEAGGVGAGVSVEFELIVVGAKEASASPNKDITASSFSNHSMKYCYCFSKNSDKSM
jgi:hypothetical protein